ncbi:MAG: hypothetical protein ACTSYR_03275 [Candidatus Odinarchaeia archaeon]
MFNENIEEIIDQKVYNFFQVKVSFSSRGSNILKSYIIADLEDVKSNFLKLHSDMKELGLLPCLKREIIKFNKNGEDESELILEIKHFPVPEKTSIKLNIILLFITVFTVTLTGYFMASTPHF